MRQLELAVGPKTKRRKSESDGPEGRKSAQAPGQYLGYSLQATRLLQMLLDGEPGRIYSLEVFEDVGEERPGGEKIAVQTKSLREGNPVADRSLDLWKTFGNWIRAVEDGTLPLEATTFEIYISAPKSGRIVELFHKATTEADARSAIAQARKALRGRGARSGKSKSVETGLDPYLGRFFGAKEETVVEIVRRFRLVTGSGRPQADLKRLLEKTLVPPEFVEPVLYQALGWIKHQTDSLLEQGKPAAIRCEEFRSTITSFVRKCACRDILVSWAREPSREAVKADLLRTYVRQLELIECEDDDKLRAINDFLRAAVDRTNWSKAGMIHSSSLDDFENTLASFWKNRRQQNRLVHGRSGAIGQGKLLYLDCVSHRARLEGLEVPDHFTPGSFHALADAQEIGWHPEYRTRLHSSEKEIPKETGT